jgi:hypothetical protein
MSYSVKLGHELGSDLDSSQHACSIEVHRELPTPSYESPLLISFQRTIRVSDNNSTNDLPPDLDSFPLFKTSDYEETLPSQMKAKGGYFLPMHRKSRPHSGA